MTAPTVSTPSRTPGRTGAPAGVWWLSPVAVTLIIVPVAVLSTAVIGDDVFREQWRTPKTITVETCLLLLTGGLMLALGATLVASLRPLRTRTRPWPDLTASDVRLLRRAGRAFFCLTIVGYAAFVVSGIRSGITVSQIAATFGSAGVYDSGIKDQLGTIPGVTTLTQVGIASVVVSSLLLAHTPARAQRVQLAVVFALALPRAFLLTERLAILELAVPVIVIAAMRWSGSRSGSRRMAVVPFVFAPFVLAVFAVFEYTRSWVYFREGSDSSFLRFAVERLVGYYATALNNGALEITYNRYSGRWPHETLSAFWTAPAIDRVDLYEQLSGRDNAQLYTQILQTRGTPEFNNSSGLAAPFVDLGTTGGLLYLLLSGVVIGLLYRSFRESDPLGLLLYPVVFIGIVELPRYLAWSQGRVFPALLAFVVLAWLWRSRPPPRPLT